MQYPYYASQLRKSPDWTIHKEIQLRTVNAKAYGAKGDLVTNDSESIQKALDDVNEMGGGTVYVPSGNYLIDETLKIHSNTTLKGDGSATTFHLDAGENRALIQNAEAGDSFIFIESIAINGAGDQQTNPDRPETYPWAGAIFFKGVRNGSIRNVVMENAFRYGIQIAGSVWEDNDLEYASQDILITGCDVSGCGDDGITIHYSKRVTISDCRLHSMTSSGFSPSGNSNGIEFDDGCDECIAINCIMFDCKNGIQIKGHEDRKGARRVTVSNCLIMDSQESGIEIRQGDDIGKPHTILITNCQILRSGLKGIFVQYYDRVTISNCIIDEANDWGVQFSNSQNLVLDNVRIRNVRGNGIVTSGTIVGVSNLTVRGCRIEGVTAFSTEAGNGIKQNSAGKNILIIDTDIDNIKGDHVVINNGDDTTIQNVRMSGGKKGIFVSTAKTRQLSVSDCVIKENSNHAIHLASGVSDGIFTNNRLLNNGGSALLADAILTDSIVSHNHLKGNALDQICLKGAATRNNLRANLVRKGAGLPDFALNIESETAEGNVVSHNDFRGGGTTAIQDNGTNTIQEGNQV